MKWEYCDALKITILIACDYSCSTTVNLTTSKKKWRNKKEEQKANFLSELQHMVCEHNKDVH